MNFYDVCSVIYWFSTRCLQMSDWNIWSEHFTTFPKFHTNISVFCVLSITPDYSVRYTKWFLCRRYLEIVVSVPHIAMQYTYVLCVLFSSVNRDIPTGHSTPHTPCHTKANKISEFEKQEVLGRIGLYRDVIRNYGETSQVCDNVRRV
jgi:hypothetical protein